MKTITFKSTPEYFRKEFLGLKQNTIRKFDLEEDKDDRRFQILEDYKNRMINVLLIEIINSENPDELFTRIVSDVTKIDDYYIISWK